MPPSAHTLRLSTRDVPLAERLLSRAEGRLLADHDGGSCSRRDITSADDERDGCRRWVVIWTT